MAQDVVVAHPPPGGVDHVHEKGVGWVEAQAGVDGVVQGTLKRLRKCRFSTVLTVVS